MIATIAPLVQVASAKVARAALFAHFSGLAIGALFTVVGVAVAASFVVPHSELAVRVVGLLFIGLAILERFGRLPQSGWQVPTGWMRERQIVGSFRYGVALGTGFATKAP